MSETVSVSCLDCRKRKSVDQFVRLQLNTCTVQRNTCKDCRRQWAQIFRDARDQNKHVALKSWKSHFPKEHKTLRNHFFEVFRDLSELFDFDTFFARYPGWTPPTAFFRFEAGHTVELDTRSSGATPPGAGTAATVKQEQLDSAHTARGLSRRHTV